MALESPTSCSGNGDGHYQDGGPVSCVTGGSLRHGGALDTDDLQRVECVWVQLKHGRHERNRLLAKILQCARGNNLHHQAPCMTRSQRDSAALTLHLYFLAL